jgi:acyl CoA:acetate/3-ketoacid CoA transferase
LDVLVNNAGLGLYSLFTAGRGVEVNNWKLAVEEEGHIIMFVERVYKIVFSGKYAVEEGDGGSLPGAGGGGAQR